MDYFITGKTYEETMAKINILNMDKLILNDWSSILKNGEFEMEMVFSAFGNTEQEARIIEKHNSIIVIIEDKETIIKNIKTLAYYDRYLVALLKNNQRYLITNQGKVINLSQINYSQKTGEKFRLRYNNEYVKYMTKFMVVDVVGEQAIAIINEDGVVLKINTGMNRVAIEMREVSIDSRRLEINIRGRYKETKTSRNVRKTLYLNKYDLNMIEEDYWETGDKLTWEYL